MAIESQFHVSQQSAARRFALGAAFFYGTTLGVVGVYLPFFPVWLTSINIDASWIGIIIAVPSFSRFTVLPFITAFAERRHFLRGALVIAAFLTALGFAVLGSLTSPIAILVVFTLTACAWTPLGPLTDGYALKGVARYGLDYGPLRLWGSAAFVVGALGCGVVLDFVAAKHLIWIIVAAAALSGLVSLGLQPLSETLKVAPVSLSRATALLKQPLFVAILVVAALVQGSHAAYYGFASINWQKAGLDGITIAALWSVGVIAEIIVFALSPRFRASPASLVLIGAAAALLRWVIMAQEPPIALLALVQLMHGLSFGLTHLGTIGLLTRSVPHHVLASAQGYLVAAIGMVTTLTMVASGLIYARFGQGVYFAMAAMSFAAVILIVILRKKLDAESSI